MKEWKCVHIGHHKDIGKTIEAWEKKGWRLHTYQVTGRDTGSAITCCLRKASK